MKLVIKKKKQKPERYVYNPYEDGISQSALATFLNCRETARLRYVHQLEPKQGKLCFRQGKRFDELLKYYYDNIHEYSGAADAVEAMTEHLRGLEKQARKSINFEEAKHDIGVASVLLPEYIAHNWKWDSSVYWVSMGEKFDKIPLWTEDNKKVFLKGEFDGTFSETGKIPCGFIENKFYARVSDYLLDYLPLDLQLAFYLAANYRFLTAVFNVIRKPSIRKSKGETLAAYLERFRQDIKGRPDWYFTRVRLDLISKEKKQLHDRIRRLATEFCRWWDEAKNSKLEDRDLMWNSSQCESKFGVCPYLSACANKSYSDYELRGKT